MKVISFKQSFCILLLSAFTFGSNAQSPSYYSLDSVKSNLINWYNLSPSKDKIQGVEVDRAYSELLVNKTPKKKIIVAVIDGGVDYTHADLQGKVWTNEKEILDNGIDDDNNGYIDDIHGWNFIGNSKHENIRDENVEETRIYRDFNPLYGKINSAEGLTDAQKAEYMLYQKAKKVFMDELSKYTNMNNNVEAFEKEFTYVEKIVKDYLGKQTYTVDDLKAIKTSDETVMRAKSYLLSRYEKGFSYKFLEDYKKYIDEHLKKNYNTQFQPRSIIGDNPSDITDRNYGNNDVIGPRPDHGTPVSGIITAIRNNNLGVNGIAEDVQIMVLRAVPNGDERDKDIALAIRYAVDNGANIINMSFGKKFSPQKQFVDEAVKYAESKNVLLIHSAGNDAFNLDTVNSYPTNILMDGSKVNNWITVGATSNKLGKKFCGNFSNYGQNNVDIFAPGVDIVTLYPGQKYSTMDGTSFSGPVVTGVAALVWSFYPELTAAELKDVLLQSCTVYPKQKVYYPNLQGGKNKKTKFGTLSKTGGIVNAYNALLLAEKKVNEKNNTTKVSLR